MPLWLVHEVCPKTTVTEATVTKKARFPDARKAGRINENQINTAASRPMHCRNSERLPSRSARFRLQDAAPLPIVLGCESVDH